jgi:SNF2 family DNA or RNA helicase
MEWKARDKWIKALEEFPDDPEPPALFLDTEWYRIIIDEAQVIKNRSTLTARGIIDLRARYRWSLSGTPMQNGVEEIFSQLSYLRIRPYNDWQKFRETFVQGLKSPGSRKGAMKKFQTLLKAILLRRTKKSKIDGVEICKDLPDKEVNIVHATFDEEQLDFYQNLERGAVVELKRYRDAGTLGKNISRGLVLLLRLRQACLHPRLVTEGEKLKEAGELTGDQQVNLAKDFSEQTVKRIQEIASFECPVCMDTYLNPSLVFPCGHHVCPPLLFWMMLMG